MGLGKLISQFSSKSNRTKVYRTFCQSRVCADSFNGTLAEGSQIFRYSIRDRTWSMRNCSLSKICQILSLGQLVRVQESASRSVDKLMHCYNTYSLAKQTRSVSVWTSNPYLNPFGPNLNVLHGIRYGVDMRLGFIRWNFRRSPSPLAWPSAIDNLEVNLGRLYRGYISMAVCLGDLATLTSTSSLTWA